MNKQIWKFDLEITDVQQIEIPKEAEILTIQEQFGTLKLWALVNPENEMEARNIEVFGTGHNVYCDMGVDREYIATAQTGALVWHVFERTD